jgi:4-hydroxy-3-polyprenylbenzoate decarboxylase
MANAGVPDVQQVWCHEVGGARMFHGVSIKQRYPGHALQAGTIAAQCGGSAYASKYIVVTDEDVDVTNLEALIWAMLTRTDPIESIQILDGAWDSPADPRIPPEKRKTHMHWLKQALLRELELAQDKKDAA